MFRDHCLYEIEVEFTHTIVFREGQDMDYAGEKKRPDTKITLRLIADRFYQDHKTNDEGHGVMLEAWVASHFRFQKEQDFKILSVETHNISGYLIS